MPLANGTRLGSFEILAPIGAGGMGEVYRARDTKLDREVAVKVLPTALAQDPERLARFEREAKVLASLNHPNIVAIYDVGSENGILYIVTELVEGDSLSGIKLGLRRALDCAVQIATGLAAAHAALITHRDLKPDNILLTRDGRIKILDFGLAKAAPRPPSGSGETETLTVHTDPGMVLGTVGYMSPEQVRGLAADHRSDIFSFGVILYELLYGQRAFQGETAVETMTAILKQDPPELPDTVPPGVRQTVSHCLEKEPANRFQSARDLSFALAAMPQSSSPSGAAQALPSPPRWRKRALTAAAALVLIAMAVTATRLFWPVAPPQSWSGAILGGPEMAFDPRLSPDGHLVAFQAMDRGQTQVAVMKPETGNWSILTHDRIRGEINEVAWSPDGAVIYYDRYTDVPQGIYSVPVLGGEERLVLENASEPEPLPDGTLLAVKLNTERKKQLLRFWPETGRLQDLPILITGAVIDLTYHVRAFPDGKDAVVVGTALRHEQEAPRLLAVNIATGASRPLLPPEERVVPTAWAVARDGKSVIAALPAGSLTRIVSIPANGRSQARTLFTVNALVWHLDIAVDGSVYASLTDRPAELVRRSLGGEKSEAISNFPGVYRDAMVALPDGRVVFSGLASGRGRLMAVQIGKDPVQLANTTEETSSPMTVVKPREIALVIGAEPRDTIAVAETTTGRITHRISPGKGEIKSLAASPDGRTLYFAAGGAIWTIPASGGEQRMIRAGDSVAADPSGRYLLVSVTESARWRLFRLPLGGGAEQEVTLQGSDPVMGWPLETGAFSADGRLLLPLQPLDSWFNAPGLLDTATGRLTRLPSDEVSDWHSMAWLPDGQIMALHVGLRSTLWRFQPAASAGKP
jgi:eukaryotic-like serine/threonine-protein kinase